MIIMNCCDCYWQPQPPAYSTRPYPRDYLPANQVPFVPDYVYNPKEARIRKAMRDQASRARAVHQHHQRLHQHHPQQQHQAQNRQQYLMPMGGRNEIITRARLNSLPRQASSPNVMQNHKISHLRIQPHILQQKPNQIQLHQISQGICNEACNQQWMVGIEQRSMNHHVQQELAHSQTKAAIREQVEHGLMDGVYGNFMDMESIPYHSARVVGVTGGGCSDGLVDRPGPQDSGHMGPQVSATNTQEFTVFTDVDGHQHWYPYTQAEDIKVFSGGPLVNNWNQHQGQQLQHQVPQHHVRNENHDMKIPQEHQQLFQLQCLVEASSTDPLQVSSPEGSTRGDEISQPQQYIMSPPQQKFMGPTKVESAEIKADPDEVEHSQTSGATLTTLEYNDTNSNEEDLGERNPDSLPLPAFQQAFGSTEIGRFANEGFLSQSPEAPNWTDPSSPFGLSSPPHTSNPAAAYYFSPSGVDEMPTNHTIAFPQSLASYFDCTMLEEIDGTSGGYGDLVSLVGTEGSSGFDFLALHVPTTEKDEDHLMPTGTEDLKDDLVEQENSELLLLKPPGPS